ncbi:MAG: putative rane protein [Alphaproteobacteria bacterium]|nr:putative rane protein [Alphaproteobacteria bacterium]
MTSHNGVTVAIFDTHDKAERALHSLNNAGIDLKKISIVGREIQREEHALGFYNLGDRIKFFGGLGAFWGSLAGILLGSFVMFIPVFGHLIILGPLAATVVSGLQGAVVGGTAGVLGGALTALGVPKDSVIRYETALNSGKFLVTVQGSREDADLARQVLAAEQPSVLEAHNVNVEASA